MERYGKFDREFDVPAGKAVFDLVGVGGVTTVTAAAATDFEATYFDTGGLRLAVYLITLRCRTGGDDEGWCLTFGQGGTRGEEIWLPLDATAAGGRARTIPPGDPRGGAHGRSPAGGGGANAAARSPEPTSYFDLKK
jgi:hypothetical protein